MKKIVLLAAIFLASLNCYAISITQTSAMATIIKNATKQPNASNQSAAIMYSGQDIARPMVATDNRSSQSNQAAPYFG